MKSKSILLGVMFCLALLTLSQSSYCQWTNLIRNPSFELGTVPPGSMSIYDDLSDYVTDWDGCGNFGGGNLGTPDIFDPAAPPCGTPLSVDVPDNKWGSLNAFLGSRYVGFSSSEAVLGTLDQTLVEGCTYRLRMRTAGAGSGINCGVNPISPFLFAFIEVRLKNSCGSNSLLIYSSGSFNTVDWHYFEFTFVATAAMTGFNRIEFTTDGTIPGRPVYLDDVGLEKATVAITSVGGNSIICIGEQVNLTAMNGDTWTSIPQDPTLVGQENDPSIFVSPVVTTTYVNTSGCSYDEITITVNPFPTVDLGPDQLVCDWPVNLDAGSGFDSYNWYVPGGCPTNGQFATACSTGIYCVTVTQNGCSASDCVSITKVPSPNIFISSSIEEPCELDEVQLTANGTCQGTCTYSWSNIPSTNSSISVSPAIPTTYTVTVTNSSGCTDVASYTVTPVYCEPKPLCRVIRNNEDNDIGEAVIATDDGGCVIVGTMFNETPSFDRDMYFVKYNYLLQGLPDVIATRIGGIYDDEGYSVVHRPGDGYYIAGTAIVSEYEQNIYVAKLSETGEQIWGYMYGNDNNRIEVARKIIDMSDAGEENLMIVGYTNSTSSVVSNFDVLAIKIRLNGVLVTQNTFSGPKNSNDYGYDVARYDINSLQSEYFIVGERSLGSAQDAIVIKVDASLTHLDSKIINNSDRNEVANSVAILPKQTGADVFVAGSISNKTNGLSDIYLFKLNNYLQIGSVPNNVILSNPEESTYEIARKLKVTSDDQLIIAAESGYDFNNGTDALVLKVDPATLLPVWASSTNLPVESEVFNDIAQLNDGTFVGTGFYTMSPTDRDIFVSRITNEGISCCLSEYHLISDKDYLASGYLKTKVPVLSRKPYGAATEDYDQDKICTEVNQRSIASNSGSVLNSLVNILPNPNAGEFVVELIHDSSTIRTVNVFDISGRVIKTMVTESSVSKLSISAAEFDSGIYFVEIITNTDDRYTSRVVIQK